MRGMRASGTKNENAAGNTALGSIATCLTACASCARSMRKHTALQARLCVLRRVARRAATELLLCQMRAMPRVASRLPAGCYSDAEYSGIASRS